MKDVLVIGGGPWQMPLVRFLKDKGHSVWIVNPIKSPTVSEGDRHIANDVRDLEGILHIIKGLDVNFQLVASDQSDIAMPTVAGIAKELKLPGNPPEVVELFTNKEKMYHYAETLGIKVPYFQSVANYEQLHNFVYTTQIPLIIKPADNHSSRGFYKIDRDNEKALRENFEEAQRWSRVKKVIVQQYVEGEEITVDGVYDGKVHQTLTTSLKTLFRPGLTAALKYPCRITDEVLEEVKRQNDEFVTKAGMNFCLTHAEYTLERNNIWLIEIAGRGGGSGISSEIIPWVSGANTYEFLYQSWIGNKPDLPLRTLPRERSAVVQFFEYPSGKVTAIEGEEEVAKIRGVKSLRLNFKVGDCLPKVLCGTDRHSLVLILTDSDEELLNAVEKVRDTLVVRVSQCFETKTY